MFATLMSKIFGHKAAEAPAAAAPAPAAAAQPTPVAAGASAAPVAPAAAAAAAVATPAPLNQVDVAAVLDGMAAKSGEKDLDWRKSIVDLMKVVGMDSSFKARQELAKDLNYTGDMHDSASMNIWLHKEVMQRFAANGGKLPSNLV